MTSLRESEVWKQVEGYGGFYEVSTHGRVRSYRVRGDIRREDPIILRFSLRAGYPSLNLVALDGTKKSFCIHWIVARTFLGPQLPGIDINHLDGNRANAALANLKYVTRSENQLYRQVCGTDHAGEKNHQAKLTADQAASIRREFKMVSAKRSNIPALALKYGVSRSTIDQVIKGNTWKSDVRLKSLSVEVGE